MYWRCYHGVQMSDAIHVLVVDDDKNVRSLLVAVLSRSPFTVAEAASGGDAMAHLAREGFDVALVDLQLPDHSGLDILRWARDADVDAELIVLTGHADVETAVEAMRLGAYDFITKPVDYHHLLLVVQRALRERSLQDEVVYLREQLQSRYSFQNIISKNPKMHAIFELINNLSHSVTTVLIEGETGTGKEQVARAIRTLRGMSHDVA